MSNIANNSIALMIVLAIVSLSAGWIAYHAGRYIERSRNDRAQSNKRMADLEEAIKQVTMKRLPHDILQQIEDVNAVLPEIELHQEIVTAHLITMQRRLDALRNSRVEQERTRYGERRLHPEELT